MVFSVGGRLDRERHPGFPLGGLGCTIKSSNTRRRRCSLTAFTNDTPMNFTTSTARSSSYTAQSPTRPTYGWRRWNARARKAVVTQNIDGLHQAAGSKVVYELHGLYLCATTARAAGKFFPVSFIEDAAARRRRRTPLRRECGGIVKPDVVLYEEGLDEADDGKRRERHSQGRHPLLSAALRLAVYPAAGCCGISGVTTLLSSTNSPPRRTPWPICLSTSQSAARWTPMTMWRRNFYTKIYGFSQKGIAKRRGFLL